MTNNELIDAAINVLKTGGLTKFERGDRNEINSPHCILGAFDCCLPKHDSINNIEHEDMLIKVKANIPPKFQTYNYPTWDLVNYNNDENTTLEDIINLLEISKANV